MRFAGPFAAILALAAPALAQPPATAGAPPMGDKGAAPATPGRAGKDESVDPGLPSDVHATPPPVASQAPPPTTGDAAPVESKGKGRARPASATPKKPQV